MIIEGFRKTYRGRTVLDTAEITLEEGSVTCVIGSNGCGKSTLLRCIAGTVDPDGRREGPDRPETGYMPQKSYPFKMSVEKNLLIGLPRTDENRKRAMELLGELGMSSLAGERADRLSGGETQKMALLRVLMRDRGLLLLDEPTSSMDADSAIRAEKLIRDYTDRTGCVCLMVTHLMKQAQRISDGIIYMNSGRISEHMPTEDFFSGKTGPEASRFLELWGA